MQSYFQIRAIATNVDEAVLVIGQMNSETSIVGIIIHIFHIFGSP